MGAVPTSCFNPQGVKGTEEIFEAVLSPETVVSQPYFAAGDAKSEPFSRQLSEDGSSSEPEQEPHSLVDNLDKPAKQSHGHFMVAVDSSVSLATTAHPETDATPTINDSESEVTHDDPISRSSNATQRSVDPTSPLWESEHDRRCDDSHQTSLVNAGFQIDFDVGKGSIKTITVAKRPLGIVFGTKAPVCVNRVREGSHAVELGIQPGWKIKAVAGEAMKGLKADKIQSKIQSHVQALPDSSEFVELVFIADEGDKAITVPRGSLGITFAQAEPLTVDEVRTNSTAERLGVQVGWAMKSIAGEDVSQMEFYRALDVFDFAIMPGRKAENVTSFKKRMANNGDGEQAKTF